MMSTAERLVAMANQIARELGNQRAETAVAATRDHLRRFWDPRMRDTIIAHLEVGGEGLGAIAREAVALLREAGNSAPGSGGAGEGDHAGAR